MRLYCFFRIHTGEAVVEHPAGVQIILHACGRGGKNGNQMSLWTAKILPKNDYHNMQQNLKWKINVFWNLRFSLLGLISSHPLVPLYLLTPLVAFKTSLLQSPLLLKQKVELSVSFPAVLRNPMFFSRKWYYEKTLNFLFKRPQSAIFLCFLGV